MKTPRFYSKSKRGSVMAIAMMVLIITTMYAMLLLNAGLAARERSKRNVESIEAFYWMDGRAKLARYLAAERLLNSGRLDGPTLYNQVGDPTFGDKFRPQSGTDPGYFPGLAAPPMDTTVPAIPSE
jgi:hypothetical protein